jgi:hypothetical protein
MSLSRRLTRFLGAEIIRKPAKTFDEVIDLCAPIWLLTKDSKGFRKLQEKRNGVFWTPLIFWRGKAFKPFLPDRVLKEPSAYHCPRRRVYINQVGENVKFIKLRMRIKGDIEGAPDRL